MYAWKADPELCFTHAQDGLNVHFLRMFKGTFSLDMVHVLFLDHVAVESKSSTGKQDMELAQHSSITPTSYNSYVRQILKM